MVFNLSIHGLETKATRSENALLREGVSRIKDKNKQRTHFENKSIQGANRSQNVWRRHGAKRSQNISVFRQPPYFFPLLAWH